MLAGTLHAEGGVRLEVSGCSHVTVLCMLYCDCAVHAVVRRACCDVSAATLHFVQPLTIHAASVFLSGGCGPARQIGFCNTSFV